MLIALCLSLEQEGETSDINFREYSWLPEVSRIRRHSVSVRVEWVLLSIQSAERKKHGDLIKIIHLYGQISRVFFSRFDVQKSSGPRSSRNHALPTEFEKLSYLQRQGENVSETFFRTLNLGNFNWHLTFFFSLFIFSFRSWKKIMILSFMTSIERAWVNHFLYTYLASRRSSLIQSWLSACTRTMTYFRIVQSTPPALQYTIRSSISSSNVEGMRRQKRLTTAATNGTSQSLMPAK